MIKILFICHGNICRSVSAQYIMEDLAKKNGVELYVSSAATSREEIGNYLGLTLETVSRLFSRFQREGLIRIQQREIRLINKPGIQDLLRID